MGVVVVVVVASSVVVVVVVAAVVVVVVVVVEVKVVVPSELGLTRAIWTPAAPVLGRVQIWLVWNVRIRSC